MHRSRYSDRFHYLQSTESRSLTPIYLNRRLNGRWRGQGRWRAVSGYISVVSAEWVWNWCSATNWIIITDPFRPGKLKNTSGPFRCGICRSTFNSLAECLGCGAEEGIHRVKNGESFVCPSIYCYSPICPERTSWRQTAASAPSPWYCSWPKRPAFRLVGLWERGRDRDN